MNVSIEDNIDFNLTYSLYIYYKYQNYLEPRKMISCEHSANYKKEKARDAAEAM